MRKISPFLKSPKFEISKVGNAYTGYMYMLKKNGLSPCENPVDLQEASKRQAKVTALILESIKNYAEKQGITESEAREAMFDEKSQVSLNPVDYLPMEQKEDYFQLVDQVKTLPYKAASLMIRYRAVYPVEVVSNARTGAVEVKTQPIGFSATPGDRLRFDNNIVELVAKVSEGDESISVKPLDFNLAANKVGFLIDFETNVEKVGFPDWTEKSTAEYLLESQVKAVYDFYRSETGELPTEDEEKQSAKEGELVKSSSNDSAASQPAA
jgi:hypothetical protein